MFYLMIDYLTLLMNGIIDIDLKFNGMVLEPFLETGCNLQIVGEYHYRVMLENP